MSVDDTIQAAKAQFEAQGVYPSIAKIQAATGIGKHRVGRVLAQLRKCPPPPEPPPEPPPLTLAEVRQVARQIQLGGLAPHPERVALVLLPQGRVPPLAPERAMQRGRSAQGHHVEAAVWATLLPVVETLAARTLIAWQMGKLEGQVCWSQGHEPRTLAALWQRHVVEPLGPIRPEERQQHEHAQWAALGRAYWAREAQEARHRAGW